MSFNGKTKTGRAFLSRLLLPRLIRISDPCGFRSLFFLKFK